MRWFFGACVVILVVTLSFFVFYTTGGSALVRVLQNYLFKDLPDKHYTWRDFVPDNTSQKVSGFYSSTFSNGKTVAIWTLAGLKLYHDLPGTSVYYYRDACAQVQAIKNGGEVKPVSQASLYIPYLDIASWRSVMRSEYLVTVEWAKVGGKRVISNVWSVSGRYKVLGQIGAGVCD